MDEELLDMLNEQVILGRRSDRGFKTEAYTNVTKAMIESSITNLHITEAQARNRVKKLKQDFQVVFELINASGFGFDNTTKRVTASPEVWEDWLKGYPSHQPWQKKIMDYPNLSMVFGADIATGRYANPTNNEDDHPELNKLDSSYSNTQAEDEGVSESSGASKTKQNAKVLDELVQTMKESALSLENALKDVATMISISEKQLASEIYKELKKVDGLLPEEIDVCHEWLTTNSSKANLFLKTEEKSGCLSRRMTQIHNWSASNP